MEVAREMGGGEERVEPTLWDHVERNYGGKTDCWYEIEYINCHEELGKRRSWGVGLGKKILINERLFDEYRGWRWCDIRPLKLDSDSSWKNGLVKVLTKTHPFRLCHYFERDSMMGRVKIRGHRRWVTFHPLDLFNPSIAGSEDGTCAAGCKSSEIKHLAELDVHADAKKWRHAHENCRAEASVPRLDVVP